MHRKIISPFGLQPHRSPLLYAFLLSISLLLLTMGPLGINVPVASAHAYLLRSDPPANAILNAPPEIVRMWFSEQLNPFTSYAVIVDTTNHEVDTDKGTVNSANAMEIDVTPLLLRAGTYVVIWRSQSAEDGHITGSSFIFRIARPDGSIPPVPNVLPTGHIPGAAGSGLSANTATLDGPTLLQTLMTWLALLNMTLWVGGIFWETWVLPPTLQSDSDVAVASHGATRRFQWLASSALILVLLSDIGIMLGQAAEVAGDWSGIFSLPSLRAVLFGSHFGMVWWIRQGIALLALLVLLLARRSRQLEQVKQVSENNRLQTVADAHHTEIHPIPNWWNAVVETFKHISALPRHLVAGWHARSWIGRLEVLLGIALILAFALSGHAAAVPSSQLPYALSIDLLHLICTTIWVGGLFYLDMAFVPALSALTESQQARVIASGLPKFSAIAIMSVLILALTGSLNTAIHLTALAQLVTTLYGRILTSKIVLFLVMIAISAYHSFFLRSRLVQALAKSNIPSAVAISSTFLTGKDDMPAKTTSTDELVHQQDTFLQINTFTKNIMRWIQREALIGGAILLCVALLGAFAGTLAPAAPAATTTTDQSSGPLLQTQSVQGYRVTLNVAPDTFGTNTFTVTVADHRGRMVQGAAVLAETTMLDMDMGSDALQLQANASSPGTFSGQSELTMAGHWRVRLKILPPNEKTFVIVTFIFETR